MLVSSKAEDSELSVDLAANSSRTEPARLLEPTKVLDEGLESRDFACSLSSPMVKGTK